MTSSLPIEIENELRGRSAIVSGGTGLIGREICRLLADAGADVTSLSLDNLQPDSRVHYQIGDLSQLDVCIEACRDKDFIFHVAGIKGSVTMVKQHPASFMVPLLMMNTNFLEAARRAEPKAAVFTSTIGCYGAAEEFVEDDFSLTDPPMDLYPGWAKRVAELQIDAYRIQYGLEKFSVVRPANVYGPGDNFDPENAMVIPSLMSKVLNRDGPVEIWGDGSAERDFCFSEDVARGTILACLKGDKGQFCNLGSGTSVSIRSLVETLQEVVPFEAFFDETKPSGYPRRVMRIERARNVLGYKPMVSLKEGLQRTWDWYVEHSGESDLRKNYFREAEG